MVDHSNAAGDRLTPVLAAVSAVWNLLRIVTFPIWFPIKALWMLSKFVAFLFLVILIAAVLYLVLLGI